MPKVLTYQKVKESLARGYEKLLETSTVDRAANEQIFLRYKSLGGKNMFQKVMKKIAEVDLKNGEAIVAQLKSAGKTDEDIAETLAILKLLGEKPDLETIAKLAGIEIEADTTELDKVTKELATVKAALKSFDEPKEPIKDEFADLPEKVQKAMTDQKAELDRITKQAADLQDKMFTKELTDKVEKNYSGVGDKETLVSILKAITATPEVVEKLEAIFAAHQAVLKDSGLFDELGTGRPGNSDEPSDEFEKKTKAYAKEKGIDIDTAYGEFGNTEEGIRIRKEMEKALVE